MARQSIAPGYLQTVAAGRLRAREAKLERDARAKLQREVDERTLQRQLATGIVSALVQGGVNIGGAALKDMWDREAEQRKFEREAAVTTGAISHPGLDRALRNIVGKAQVPEARALPSREAPAAVPPAPPTSAVPSAAPTPDPGSPGGPPTQAPPGAPTTQKAQRREMKAAAQLPRTPEAVRAFLEREGREVGPSGAPSGASQQIQTAAQLSRSAAQKPAAIFARMSEEERARFEPLYNVALQTRGERAQQARSRDTTQRYQLEQMASMRRSEATTAAGQRESVDLVVRTTDPTSAESYFGTNAGATGRNFARGLIPVSSEDMIASFREDRRGLKEWYDNLNEDEQRLYGYRIPFVTTRPMTDAERDAADEANKAAERRRRRDPRRANVQPRSRSAPSLTGKTVGINVERSLIENTAGDRGRLFANPGENTVYFTDTNQVDFLMNHLGKFVADGPGVGEDGYEEFQAAKDHVYKNRNGVRAIVRAAAVRGAQLNNRQQAAVDEWIKNFEIVHAPLLRNVRAQEVTARYEHLQQIPTYDPEALAVDALTSGQARRNVGLPEAALSADQKRELETKFNDATVGRSAQFKLQTAVNEVIPGGNDRNKQSSFGGLTFYARNLRTPVMQTVTSREHLEALFGDDETNNSWAGVPLVAFLVEHRSEQLASADEADEGEPAILERARDVAREIVEQVEGRLGAEWGAGVSNFAQAGVDNFGESYQSRVNEIGGPGWFLERYVRGIRPSESSRGYTVDGSSFSRKDLGDIVRSGGATSDMSGARARAADRLYSLIRVSVNNKINQMRAGLRRARTAYDSYEGPDKAGSFREYLQGIERSDLLELLPDDDGAMLRVNPPRGPGSPAERALAALGQDVHPNVVRRVQRA